MVFGQDMMGGGGGITDDSQYERKRVGVNLARVVDIEDPEDYGRVKCAFITADEDVEDTEWAFVASPLAGNKSGMFFRPSVDDVVLLAFEEGDIHAPFVIGSVWWDDGDIKLEAPVEDPNKPEIYIINTPKGHTITLSEEEGKESIEIKTIAGHEFKLDDGENKITLQSADGDGITLDTQNGEMSIKCKKFEVDASGNKLTIGSSGATLEAKPSIDIKATTVTVEGSGTTNVKGGILNLDGDSVANLKATAVKIN